jgi:hypothetical protein
MRPWSSSFTNNKRRAVGSPLVKTFVDLDLCSLDDVYYSAATLGSEFNGTGSESKQSVILALTNVLSRVEVSSTLANNDFSCVNFLACVTLYA